MFRVVDPTSSSNIPNRSWSANSCLLHKATIEIAAVQIEPAGRPSYPQ